MFGTENLRKRLKCIPNVLNCIREATDFMETDRIVIRNWEICLSKRNSSFSKVNFIEFNYAQGSNRCSTCSSTLSRFKTYKGLLPVGSRSWIFRGKYEQITDSIMHLFSTLAINNTNIVREFQFLKRNKEFRFERSLEFEFNPLFVKLKKFQKTSHQDRSF